VPLNRRKKLATISKDGGVEMEGSRKTISQEKIIATIKEIDRENFILGTAVKMVYYGGFHKNEVENIKIKDAYQNNRIVSQIEPFLEKSRKVYTTLPIPLDDWSKKILSEHIRMLGRGGYSTLDHAPLFPDPKNKKSYESKNLQRHLKKYFKDINFDDLRQAGYEREDRRLKTKWKNNPNYQIEIQRYSRHSRPSTTKQSIEGTVQKAGKRKIEYLLWELIVKLIEKLPHFKKTPKSVVADATLKLIRNRIKEQDVKLSLIKLLDLYKQRLNIN
jgi:hypothetical protein